MMTLTREALELRALIALANDEDPREHPALVALIDGYEARLRRGEALWIDCNAVTQLTDELTPLEVATMLCVCLGEPLDVYGDDLVWSELSVHLDAMPMRTHGVGENPLHIDYIDRSAPPDRIALFGARQDPLGGGATQLADMVAAVEALEPAHRAVLEAPIFRYWTDHGATDVGEPLPRFAIIPETPGEGFVRFSAKMIPHLDGTDDVMGAEAVGRADEARDAMLALYDVLKAQRQTLKILPGELVVFEQRRLAHGRCPLGAGQARVPEGQRRSLLQAYLRRP